MPGSRLSRLLGPVAERLDRKVGWHRLPVPASIVTLIGLRQRLRERNLHDTSRLAPPPSPEDGRRPTVRAVDGSFNDPKSPAMGQAGTPFGRNVPLTYAHPENDWAIRNGPNPRVVSRELLTREVFQPATTLNLLAAAWLQFMIRDWLSHGKGDFGNAWELDLAADDPWRKEPGHKSPMPIPRTPRASQPAGNLPPVYTNTETHWWDGSQLYGSSREQQKNVRSGEDGKLDLDEDGTRIPERILTGLAREPGWWAGLALMFTVFAREHNAICDRLRREYPSWSDDDLFERARLINAALIAKIHTVEWTTALLGHPALKIAMNANWWGLATERIHRLYGRLSESEIVSGIPGSPTNHFGVPYSMTEEFVAVYRMHPMIPDHFDFRSADDHEPLPEGSYTLRAISGPHVQDLLGQVSMTNLVYSFGTTYPGALTLHNYPRFLQDFERPDGEFMDLAATDILRNRELGVPRYNEFRRLLGLTPFRNFEDLADNQAWTEELRRVYGDDIEQVDLMVGLFAEPKPAGFGISDTAFRIFILMASRRLNSDRFFTTDYTPQVYTQVGMDWIGANNMSTVLTRHLPQLLPSLYRTRNAFAPWPRTRGAG